MSFDVEDISSAQSASLHASFNAQAGTPCMLLGAAAASLHGIAATTVTAAAALKHSCDAGKTKAEEGMCFLRLYMDDR